jgi:hypothetical protein
MELNTRRDGEGVRCLDLPIDLGALSFASVAEGGIG